MKKPPEGGGNGSVGNSRLDRICVRLPSNHSAGLDCGPGLSLRSRAVCLAAVNRSRRPTKPEHMTATLDDEVAELRRANADLIVTWARHRAESHVKPRCWVRTELTESAELEVRIHSPPAK